MAGSGFIDTPVDPVRTNAKPMLRLLVPPNQQFTGELLVGVSAWANDGGSLLTTCGLQKVLVHYEGSTAEITAPSFQTFADANGHAVTYFGWWVKLNHNGTHGDAQLYFEAVPRDSSMQHRVIGPYVFFPRAAEIDLELTIAPLLPPAEGARYPTIYDALYYLAFHTDAFNTARITITEPGVYDPAGGGGLLARPDKGYVIIEATVPVTIRNPAAVSAAAAKTNWFVPDCEPVCWRGANLTLDLANAPEYYLSRGFERGWFDGCKIVNSAGQHALWYKTCRADLAATIRGKHWFTEVTTDSLGAPVLGANLVRGCNLRNGFADVANNAGLVIGTTISNWDSEGYRTRTPAMTVTYSGPGSTATIEATTAEPKVFTLKVDGSVVGTYALRYDIGYHDLDREFHVHNLVDYINTLPGWSAVLLDDTRCGQVLSTADVTRGFGFGPRSVKNTSLTLYTAFDIHSDLAQVWSSENIQYVGNLIYGSPLQCILLGDGPGKDYLFVNNVFDVPEGLEFQSQLSNTQSHLVVAHNSWIGEAITLRCDGPFVPDSYSLFAANACVTLISVPAGSALGAMTIKDNHVMDASVYGTATGTANLTSGGDRASLYADAAGHDYSPQGALLANPKTPVVQYDRLGRKRTATSPAGAQEKIDGAA